MSKAYIGIDNGVTGSIGIITEGKISFFKTPTKRELSYTKKQQHITRINVVELEHQIVQHIIGISPLVLIERPLVNPGMFKSTLSAMRALEATLGVIERIGLGYWYIDSKEWQSALLPSGIKGTPSLKSASRDIGKRLYPHLSDAIDKQKDADGLLIAHYLMSKS